MLVSILTLSVTIELLGITILIDSKSKSSSNTISLDDPLIDTDEVTQLFINVFSVNLPAPPSISFPGDVSSTRSWEFISSTLTCSKNLKSETSERDFLYILTLSKLPVKVSIFLNTSFWYEPVTIVAVLVLPSKNSNVLLYTDEGNVDILLSTI